MRKVLLLIASLFLVTVFASARQDDFYNRILSSQVDEYKAHLNASAQPSTMLAGGNMITGGQASFSRQSDFYNRVLAAHVDELQAEKSSNWAGPTLLAGNNMITGGQAWSGRSKEDFYNRVLSARMEEFQAENNSIGAGPVLLAGNNMITGERVVFTPEAAAPEDFYNRELSAKVDEYSIDNNAIAPSATEFAESQSLTILPGSMASNLGGRGESDWYGRTVATQAELNRRIKKSQAPNTF